MITTNLSVSDLTVFDWVLVTVLAYSTLTSLLRGIVLELFSLLGLIAGLLIASWNYQRLSTPIAHLLRPVFNVNDSACNVIAFLGLALGIMLFAGLSARLVRTATRTVGLGIFDRLLGAAFGFVRGCLLCIAVLMAASAFLPDSAWIRSSRLTPYFFAGLHAVSFVVPHDLRRQLLKEISELKHTAPRWIKLPR